MKQQHFVAALLMISVTCGLRVGAQVPTRLDIVWRAGAVGPNIYSMAFSPDGSMLLTDDDEPKLWRVFDGRLLQIFPWNGSSPAAFSTNGDAVLCVEDINNGLSIDSCRLSGDRSTVNRLGDVEGLRPMTSAAFSPDGQLLAIPNGLLVSLSTEVYNTADGNLFKVIGDFGTPTFSADGTLLAVRSMDHVRVWRIADGTLVNAYYGAPVCATFSPDGSKLAIGDGTDVRLWRIADGAITQTLVGHTDGVYSVTFCRDGSHLASAGPDQTLRLWSMPDGTLERVWTNDYGFNYFSMSFSPDGTTIAVGERSGIHRWRVSDGMELPSIARPRGNVTYFSYVTSTFSPDSRFLASSPGKLWRVTDGTEVTLPPGVGRPLAWSSDGVLACEDDAHNVQLWRIPQGGLLINLAGHTNWITRAVFSPDGRNLAAGGVDGNVFVWDANTGSLLKNFFDPAGEARGVAFSPDGTLFATTSDSPRGVKWWRVSDWSLLRTTETSSSAPNAVAFSPDGNLLAVGGNGYSRTYRVSDGAQIGQDLEPSPSLGFTPDGAGLFTIYQDQSPFRIDMWRVSDQTLVAQYTGEEECSGVDDLRFSPDGRFFGFTRWDGTVVLARSPFASRSTTPPLLKVSPLTAGGNAGLISLSWPTNFTSLTLESSSSLARDALWSTVPAVPSPVGDQYVVTLPATNNSQFFRLKR